MDSARAACTAGAPVNTSFFDVLDHTSDLFLRLHQPQRHLFLRRRPRCRNFILHFASLPTEMQEPKEEHVLVTTRNNFAAPTTRPRSPRVLPSASRILTIMSRTATAYSTSDASSPTLREEPSLFYDPTFDTTPESDGDFGAPGASSRLSIASILEALRAPGGADRLAALDALAEIVGTA